MQFSTHYYLFIDWMGEREALRGRGAGEGERRGGRGGRESVWLEDMTYGTSAARSVNHD